ncbi:MAG TPA: HDIG domain-containing protein [Gemmatimonadaceae bacterium]|nr:HDIG domain-containing protein [Gemmatimonadaceae bacterium]
MTVGGRIATRTPATWPPTRAALAGHGVRLAVALVLAVLTYVLFPASPAIDFPIYEVGSVASDNVIAPFAFKVMKTPQELAKEQEEVVGGVEPVYDFVPAALDSARAALDGFSAAVTQAAATNAQLATANVQHAGESWGLPLSAGQAAYLASPRKRGPLFLALHRVFDRWLSEGVASAGALDSVRGEIVIRSGGEDHRVSSDSVLTFNMLVSRARLLHPDPGSATGDSLYMRLIATFFHPTIVPDRATTELRREDVRRSIPEAKYSVQAGEKIIGANEVVGREQHEKLRALHDAADQYRGSQRGARRVVGSIAFNFVLIALLGLAFFLFRPDVYSHIRWLMTVAVLAALVLIGGAVVAYVRPVIPELVPVALAAVVLSALFGRRISMIAAMVLTTLVAGQSVFRGTNALFINLVGGAVAALTVGEIRRRNQFYQWILTIGGAYLATAVAIGLTLDLAPRAILTSAGFGVLNALVCVLLAVLVLPMAEAFTGIETDLTLLEWSDLNRPLMQRLSLEAPGTYAHTIAIANLAEAACRAIGANALLARVGAYYHDIGKIAKPQFFVENQAKGRNPHDALKPDASAQIIRNHVHEGLELAAEYKLPRALRAFITEHHGTGTISYFLDKARQRDDIPPDTTEYAYPGPLPQSAETAVVMLADGIEAATRVLHEPTPDRIRDVVDHIVRQRVEQGQLVDAPLTLRQIETIKEEFTRVLVGMYHNRIEYPAASGGVTSEFAST